MSRFMDDIRRAAREGKLEQPFRGSDVERAYPGWGKRTYRVFLAKHRVGTRVSTRPILFVSRRGSIGWWSSNE